jgi:hypothetical protein
MKYILQLVVTFPKTTFALWISFIITVVACFQTLSPPQLTFEIIGMSNVYDVHIDTPGLEVLFDGKNIRETKQRLTYYNIRITNTGDNPVAANLYQPGFPLAVEWEKGKVFSASIPSATQNFLKDNLKPKIHGDRQVRFDPVAIDGGDSFVLHEEKTGPGVKPVGKVAGLNFEGQKIPDVQFKLNFWEWLKNLGAAALFIITLAGFTALFLVIAFIYWLARKFKRIAPTLTQLLVTLEEHMKIKTMLMALDNEDLTKKVAEKRREPNGTGVGFSSE